MLGFISFSPTYYTAKLALDSKYISLFGGSVTKSELGFEYYKRTRHFDLPTDVEDALEEDYILNRELYVEGIFEYVRTYLQICPDITPDQVIELVRKYPGHS